MVVQVFPTTLPSEFSSIQFHNSNTLQALRLKRCKIRQFVEVILLHSLCRAATIGARMEAHSVYRTTRSRAHAPLVTMEISVNVSHSLWSDCLSLKYKDWPTLFLRCSFPVICKTQNPEPIT